MRLFTAYWVRQAEGEVRWSVNFDNAYWMLKVDALQDVICILQDEYQKLMEEDSGEQK